jgi:multiple sugar transport system permease protein
MQINSNSMRKRLRIIGSYMGLMLVVIFAAFPILWILSTSLKILSETFTIPPRWFPQTPTLVNYLIVWSKYPLARYLLNSIVVSMATSLISVILGCLAGYGFSRFKFWGWGSFMGFLLFSQLLPQVALMIPYYRIIQRLGILNTYTSLIIVYCSFSLPFCVWMMKGYFDSIPHEIDEAARIDGCSHFQAFANVVLPLTLPGVVSIFIFSFLTAWNEYLFTLILVSRDEMKTVTQGIASLVGAYEIAWNELAAMTLIATIPALIGFAFMQKSFIHGLTTGAVKQ